MSVRVREKERECVCVLEKKRECVRVCERGVSKGVCKRE